MANSSSPFGEELSSRASLTSPWDRPQEAAPAQQAVAGSSVERSVMLKPVSDKVSPFASIACAPFWLHCACRSWLHILMAWHEEPADFADPTFAFCWKWALADHARL